MTTYDVIARNYRFLKNFSVDQFAEAAYSLETLNLGTVAVIGSRLKVFIKKPPAILMQNPDLCSPEYYAQRYNQPLSKSVSLGVRHQIATMKLVSAKLMM